MTRKTPPSEGVSAKDLFDFGSVPASFAGVVSAGAGGAECGANARGGGDPPVLSLRDCYVGSYLEIESGESEPWYGQVSRVDYSPGVETPITVRWLVLSSAKNCPDYLKESSVYVLKGDEDGLSLESVREVRRLAAACEDHSEASLERRTLLLGPVRSWGQRHGEANPCRLPRYTCVLKSASPYPS